MFDISSESQDTSEPRQPRSTLTPTPGATPLSCDPGSARTSNLVPSSGQTVSAGPDSRREEPTRGPTTPVAEATTHRVCAGRSAAATA